MISPASLLAFLLVPFRPFCTVASPGGGGGFSNPDVQVLPQGNEIRMSAGRGQASVVCKDPQVTLIQNKVWEFLV